MVLGIVGLVTSIVPFLFIVGPICSVLAIIFGAVGIRRANRGADNKPMAVAGLVLGIVGFVVCILWVLFFVAAYNAGDSVSDGGRIHTLLFTRA
jgi:Domain of unknown function (DUF4190)